MFRRDAQNTGAIGNPSTTEQVAWEREVGGKTKGEIPVIGEVAFVHGPDGVLQAIDAASGSRHWETGDPDVSHLLTLGTDSLLVGFQGGHNVFGIDPQDGSIEWTAEVPGGRAGPAVLTEEVTVLGTDPHVAGFQDPPDLLITGLDVETGKVVWEVIPDGTPGGFKYYDGAVYYATIRNRTDHRYPVERLDPASGERTVIDEPDEPGGLVAVTDEYVVVRMGSDVGCVDHAGERGWKASPTGHVEWIVAISEGRVVVGTRVGRVAAYDLNSGEERWETVVQPMTGIRPPAVTTEAVFATSHDEHLHGLDPADGSRLWEPIDLGARTTTHPVVTNEHVLVATEDGRIHAIE